jgi:hypothetical protein
MENHQSITVANRQNKQTGRVNLMKFPKTSIGFFASFHDDTDVTRTKEVRCLRRWILFPSVFKRTLRARFLSRVVNALTLKELYSILCLFSNRTNPTWGRQNRKMSQGATTQMTKNLPKRFLQHSQGINNKSSSLILQSWSHPFAGSLEISGFPDRTWN